MSRYTSRVPEGGGTGELTWVKGKVIDETLPGDKGDLLDGGGGAAEAQFLQMKQGVDEGTPPVEQLSRKQTVKVHPPFYSEKSNCVFSALCGNEPIR